MGEFGPTRLYQGRGIMKFVFGDIYDGKWLNGLMHGHGNFIYAKIFEEDSEDEEDTKPSVTANYVGDYHEGKRTQGTLTYENGDVYTGIFTEAGLRESGGIKFFNGDEFAGIFENGAMQCGIMNFKNGDVYSGEYKDSLFHGGGKMIYKNGDEYSGEFENGSKHGQGQFTLTGRNCKLLQNKAAAFEIFAQSGEEVK